MLWRAPWGRTSQRETEKRAEWPLCTLLEMAKGQHLPLLKYKKHPKGNSFQKNINVASLWRKSPNPEDLPCELVAGESCIHEELLSLKFRISPHSFFQVISRSLLNFCFLKPCINNYVCCLSGEHSCSWGVVLHSWGLGPAGSGQHSSGCVLWDWNHRHLPG